DPLPAELRAELLVEPDRRRVPVEDRPFQPPAAAPPGDPRQLAQERASGAATPLLRKHEEILQIERRAPQERRVGEEVEREGDGLAPSMADDCLEVAPRAEAVAPDLARGRDRLVGQPLVFGESTDQPENHRHVSSPPAADRERRQAVRRATSRRPFHRSGAVPPSGTSSKTG